MSDSTMPGFDPVLFDLDGTIVDTVELIRESFRHATRTVFGEVLPDEQIMRYVGQPLMTQMEQLSTDHAGSTDLAERLRDTYVDHNHRVHDELIRRYEGVETMLLALREQGRHIGLVTSKSRPVTEMAFRAVGLEEHFAVVVTASDTTSHKPSPEPLIVALRRFAETGVRSTPETSVYIGDSPFDIEAGKAAGMATVGVTWGIFSKTSLEKAGPDYLLERPDEVVEVCLKGAVASA